MTATTMQIVTARIDALLVDSASFESRYGRSAAAFLVHLPALYRLFYRLAFDLELPVATRRTCSLVALYLGESHDFLGEASVGVDGLVDDLWVAYTALASIMDDVDMARLQGHWHGNRPLQDALDLAHNVNVVEAAVPSRVLNLLADYLGV